jgi:ketosteroid isomerase-like protein
MVEGTTGWTIDQPTVVLGDGTEFALRLTLIWHREATEWKVVHSHASVGQ